MIIELTDQNFEEEINKYEKPVLVDFFADWCSPCSLLTPILEKISEDYMDRFVLAKANLELLPQTASKYGVERIPMVALFKKGNPVGGFLGLKPEEEIRNLINKMLEDAGKGESQSGEGASGEEGEDEKIEEVIKGYEKYAEENGLGLNPNREVLKRLAKGLLANEKKYGERYCPCRRVSGDKEEDKPKICPCKWHKEEVEKDGHCFCGMFFKK